MINKWRVVLFLGVFIFILGCESSSIPIQPPNLSLTKEEKAYFKKIALGTEFGTADKKIIKWQEDIHVFLTGETNKILEQELNRIIQELDTLTFGIQIKRIRQISEANFIVFLGHGTDYVAQYEPKAKSYIKNHWGFVRLNLDNPLIYSATMYVDIFRAKEIKTQKHLLREELTQGLGLLNDAYDYDNSIFQQKWTETTDYTDIDRKIIQTLYHPKVKVNMSFSEIEMVLDK